MPGLGQKYQKAFARQARSDKSVYDHLCKVRGDFASCHRLHYLQMFLEKTAKAYLWNEMGTKNNPPDFDRSHKVIGKVLPLIVREYWKEVGYERKPDRSQLTAIRDICRELDFLAPSLDDNGRRPDNCEYPWASTADPEVIAPVDYDFPVDRKLRSSDGIMLIKIASHYTQSLVAH